MHSINCLLIILFSCLSIVYNFPFVYQGYMEAMPGSMHNICSIQMNEAYHQFAGVITRKMCNEWKSSLALFPKYRLVSC